ncbi:MAG: HAD-IIIC family phosphatase [Prochlorococcus marinus XMU1425]|nr:HAD-IIIC family phosphatase [Prochlorococcus marinus XMU1425]MCR8534147.1 HAD-IIIC family phosphatase [Prochlorococcus marinus XMU1426]
MKSKLSFLEFVKELNKNLDDAPLIIHNDISKIINNFPELLKKKRDKILENIILILRENLSCKNIFIPSFNYDYPKTGIYNVEDSEGQLGALSEYVRKKYPKYRTHVPVFSHVDIALKHDCFKPEYRIDKSFGSESFYEWFTKKNGNIIFWGCEIENTNTYIHHIENVSGVTYRFNKLFPGEVIAGQKIIPLNFEYFVRSLKYEYKYKDQGLSFLEEKNILKTYKKYDLKIYNSQSALRCLSEKLYENSFCLLSSDSKINFSKLIDSGNFVDFKDSKITIDLLSDINLELISKNELNNKVSIRTSYTSDLFLGLEEIKKEEDINYLLIIPSYDSIGCSLFSTKSLYEFFNSEEYITWRKNFLNLILNFQKNNPKIIIALTTLLPTSYIDSLSSSKSEEFILKKKFAENDIFFFDNLNKNGIQYMSLPFSAFSSKESEKNDLSELEYLRFRCPLNSSGRFKLRSFIFNYVKSLLQINNPIKAISVDLDNTLWHGLAGEDDSTISKDFPSSSNLRLQIVLKRLINQGFFITISSKNSIESIRNSFKRLKEYMVLSIDDFSDIQAGWDAKSESIRRSAKRLNISTESFIHIDDSDFEINQIRSELPETKVLKFEPNTFDLALYDLLVCNRIRRNKINESDNNRIKKLNPINFEKNKLIENQNINEYISTLSIELSILKSDSIKDNERIYQLFQRTNQFNNTTRRFSKVEINDLINNGNLFALKYSDINNQTPEIASIIVINFDSKFPSLESFILSCRFFSRGLEYVFLKEVIDQINNDFDYIEIPLKKTKKNKPFYDFIASYNLEGFCDYMTQYYDENSKVKLPCSFFELKSKSYSALYNKVNVQ